MLPEGCEGWHFEVSGHTRRSPQVRRSASVRQSATCAALGVPVRPLYAHDGRHAPDFLS